jgi:nucleotide-binding universal stress UspA family protein
VEIAGKEGEMIKLYEVADGTRPRIYPDQPHFFNNILVATDFSPVSNLAVEFAASLARRYGSVLYLTHNIILDGYRISTEPVASSLQKMHVETKKNFRRLVNSGRLFDLSYKAVILEGNLWPTIEDMIRNYEIDLLVVGTHGRGGVRKVLIGSTAEEIFRKARVPVLTVGPSTGQKRPYDLEFKDILFATDFGRGAEREAQLAFSLAQEHCSKLRLVHALPHPEAYGEDALAWEKENTLARLRELVPSGTKLYCELDFEVAVGDPVEQILRIALETRADLIVMGAKERGFLAGNVPQTKAYRVVCGAHCPVLTVRS